MEFHKEFKKECKCKNYFRKYKCDSFNENPKNCERCMLNEDNIKIAEYLENGDKGDYIKANNGAYVEIVKMCGGRYREFDLGGDIVGLTDSETIAVMFLLDNEVS